MIYNFIPKHIQLKTQAILHDKDNWYERFCYTKVSFPGSVINQTPFVMIFLYPWQNVYNIFFQDESLNVCLVK